MPGAARLTVATALPSARQLVGDLGKTAREASGLPGLEAIAEGVEALDTYARRCAVDVELVVMGVVDHGAAARLAPWIGTSPERIGSAVVDLPESEGAVALHVVARGLVTTTGRVARAVRAPVLLLVLGRSEPPDAEAIATLEALMEDRPLVVLLRASSQPAPSGLEERAQDLAWAVETLDIEALPGATLQAYLGASRWRTAPDLLRAHSTVLAVGSLTGALDLALQQQARDIRVKRAAAQARLGPTKPGPSAVKAAPTGDPLSEIKGRLQRHCQDFERGASERLQDLLMPATGSLARETEALLLSLDELQEDARTAKIETRIPPEFETRLLRTVRERIGRHCSADVVALNDLFRLLAQEIERGLAASQGPPFVPQFSCLTEDRVRRLVEVSAGLQFTYRGELPQHGFGEYFASVRKYSMLLVMGAGMFGLASYMRQYKEFMIPCTILLALYGSFSVATSARQQRVEGLEKELDAARTSIRPELKRVFAEVQKSWAGTLIQFMNEQVAGVLAELDLAIKSHQARRGAESSPERERLQRQIQSLDAAEKRLAAPAKAKDLLLASVEQLRSELKSLLLHAGGAASVAAGGGGGVMEAPARLDAGGAAAGALDAAKARLAALKAQATPAASSAPASAAESARAKLAALKAKAAERKAAKAAARSEEAKTP